MSASAPVPASAPIPVPSPDASRKLPPHPSFEQLRNQAADLHRLAKAGDADAIRRVLASHPRLKSADGDVHEPLRLNHAQFVIAREYGFESWPKLKRYVEQAELIAATASGDLVAVQRLIAAGRSIDGRDQWGNTPLGWQSDGTPQRLAIMRFLLDRGADVNAPAYNGHTPLALCAYAGDAEGVALLLSPGADPNRAREYSGETPLHLAVAKPHPGRLACVRDLLAAGADPNPRCKAGVASDRQSNAMCVGDTPLHAAAASGDRELVEALLRAGADPDLRDQNGDRPADWAARAGHPTIADVLKRQSGA